MLFVSAKYIMPLKDYYLGICQGWTVSMAKSENIFQNWLDSCENILNPSNATYPCCQLPLKIYIYFTKIIVAYLAGVICSGLICD